MRRARSRSQVLNPLPRAVSEAVAEQKSALRRRVRADIARLSANEREAASKLACARLQNETVWRQARTVLLYAPLPDELDVRPLWRAALAADKVVTLLCFDSRQENYVARRILDPVLEVLPGRFGILEPRENCPQVPLNRLDFVLVPGVAFGLDGFRVGRGQGYYDRLLVSVCGRKCGAAFDEQIVNHVPAEPHDVRLDCILTPTRWWRADRGAVLK